MTVRNGSWCGLALLHSGRMRRVLPSTTAPIFNKVKRMRFGLALASAVLDSVRRRSPSINAQAVVDAERSQLVLGSRVSAFAKIRSRLVLDLDSMPGALGSPFQVLANNDYATRTGFAKLENRGPELPVAVGPEDRRREHELQPPAREKPVK